ncbi:RNA polymerase sigma factor [Tautonia plasticadhaerens]|uniref:RNA polymerase sigma factor SigV n=1 Tax=Tautonia plasticadhaerens TaxID=2527974 RepID=A0A518H936_9BACT|nr:RNA polymerase sigma factor [Tautonia plasticadhaerens]QDV37367.1 RNA polymerase sigma factor SigV [Tautonia plasticadhaerens]
MAASHPSPLPIGPASRDGSIDWSAVLAEHGRWLRTVIRARLGEPQGVDEVMQEVSLAAVAQQAPIVDPARVGGWLYRLAVRHALLHRRSQGRRRKLVDRYARAAQAETRARPADPLTWLLADERDRLVRLAVDELPPKDRELLLLKYTEDWSCRQIADRLGLSASAVEARLHRARARLRARLDRLAQPCDGD